MKLYNNIFSLTLISFFFAACGKQNSPPVIDTAVTIWYKHNQNNLFGPKNPSYTLDDVSLIYIKNGENVSVFDGNSNAPKNVLIYENKELGANILQIYPNEPDNNNTSETIINIGNNISDTIKCAFDKPNKNSFVTTKIWYNGKLKWDVSSNSSNEFESSRLFVINK